MLYIANPIQNGRAFTRYGLYFCLWQKRCNACRLKPRQAKTASPRLYAGYVEALAIFESGKTNFNRIRYT